MKACELQIQVEGGKTASQDKWEVAINDVENKKWNIV